MGLVIRRLDSVYLCVCVFSLLCGVADGDGTREGIESREAENNTQPPQSDRVVIRACPTISNGNLARDAGNMTKMGIGWMQEIERNKKGRRVV